MQQEAHCRLSQPVELHARALPGPGRLSHREATLLRDQLLFDRQTKPDGDHSQGNTGRSGAAARSRAACGVIREDDVLELYHSNSVCAQKARIALEEKGQKAIDHIMTLRGDQYEAAYLKLNPNGVVPTLVHDGVPITESSLILYYIDDVFPQPPLMPKEPLQRHRVRMYNKLIDEYVHNSCTILTFATAFRPAFLKLAPEAWQAEINKTPLKRRAEYKRSVIEHGLDSEFAADALAQHNKLLAWMADSLKGSQYLAGDAFSVAECAVIP